LRPGAETGEHPVVTTPRRRASDRASAGDNGASTVLGMTRDELFDAFSRFVSSRGDVARPSTPPPEPLAVDGAAPEPDVEVEGAANDAVVERAHPAKVHSKAKAKKRR
jgi:hypothetical protein